MSSPVLFLGPQPWTPCQRCALFSRDHRGNCFCREVTCPVGLILRKRRQSRAPSGLHRRMAEVENLREEGIESQA